MFWTGTGATPNLPRQGSTDLAQAHETQAHEAEKRIAHPRRTPRSRDDLARPGGVPRRRGGSGRSLRGGRLGPLRLPSFDVAPASRAIGPLARPVPRDGLPAFRL